LWVLVEPVDDPGPLDAPNAGKVTAVVEKGVDEGAGGIAGRGVDDKPRRFVDQQQIGVLKHDIEGNVLRFRIERLGRWFVNYNPVAVMHGRRGSGEFFVEPDVTGVDQPAPFGVELGEAAVEAFSFEVLRDREGVAGGHAAARRLTRTWRPTPMRINASEMS